MQVLLPDCFTCITTAPQLNTLVLGAHRELFRVLGSRLPRTRVKNGSQHFCTSLAPLRMPLSVGSTDVIAPNSVAVPQITPPCGVSTGPHVSTSGRFPGFGPSFREGRGAGRTGPASASRLCCCVAGSVKVKGRGGGGGRAARLGVSETPLLPGSRHVSCHPTEQAGRPPTAAL